MANRQKVGVHANTCAITVGALCCESLISSCDACEHDAVTASKACDGCLMSCDHYTLACMLPENVPPSGSSVEWLWCQDNEEDGLE